MIVSRISKKEILAKLDINAYYREHIEGKITVGSDGWHNCKSPLPDRKDKSPSFGFNINSGAFIDHGNSEKGSIFQFEKLMHGGSEEDAKTRLALKVGIDPGRKETLEEKVTRYHNNLLLNKNNSLNMVKALGVSEETIHQLRLGYMPSFNEHPERIIFPIFDTNGSIVTLKKYNSEAVPKCTFEKGGKNSLYGIHQLNDRIDLPVVICAGEKDKTVGESYLGNQFKITTFTAGEGALPHGEYLEKAKTALTGRDLVLLYDADNAGRNGALKVAQEFLDVARSVRIGEWPQEFVEQFPKGDITDYLTKFKPSSGTSVENLVNNIINSAAPFSIKPEKQKMKPIPDFLPQGVVGYNRICGPIAEDIEGYQKIRVTKEGEIRTPISNFVIIPREATDLTNGAEVLKCEFRHRNQEIAQVILEKSSWNSKKDFLEKLPSRKYWFAGSERDIQYIKGIVGEYNISASEGTDIFGYVKDKQGNRMYVLPDGTISSGEQVMEYIPPPGGNPLQSHFVPLIYVEDTDSFLGDLLPPLYALHDRLPLLCTLGWFCATPFKQPIMDLQGHFPSLNVFGTKGSGKTTYLSHFLQLFGFEGKMYSCSLTEFRWIRILSSTNCFPVCFDEFKTADLHPAHVDMIKQIVRKAYNQTLEPRGRPDQSIVEYPLHAPIIISGESIFQDSAIMERIVPVHLSFQALTEDHKNAHRQLNKLPLPAFLPIYLQWCLKQNANAFWESAEVTYNRIENLQDVPDRIKDNIITVIFGLQALTKFTTGHNLDSLCYSPENLAEYFLGEVTEERSCRIALDVLLEKLADMAERGHINKDVDYKIEDEIVYIRLKQCVDIFRAWAFRHQYKGEVLEYEAYRKMLKERLDLYVENVSVRIRFGGNQQRCVGINIRKAVHANIELEGFLNR